MPLAIVGFEPTQFSLVELESTPLDQSGRLSMLSLDVERDHYHTTSNSRIWTRRRRAALVFMPRVVHHHLEGLDVGSSHQH